MNDLGFHNNEYNNLAHCFQVKLSSNNSILIYCNIMFTIVPDVFVLPFPVQFHDFPYRSLSIHERQPPNHVPLQTVR